MPVYPATSRALSGSFGAISGAWQYPPNLSSSVVGSLTSGTLTLVALDVGPTAKAFTALAVAVSSAQVGGSTTTTLGLYPDNGSGGLPNLVGGPIVSGTIPMTPVGNATFTPASPFTLAAGRYWMAFLYVVTTAPTTVSTVRVFSTGTSIWISSASTIGAAITFGLSSIGQTVLPTTQITLSPNAGPPVVAAKAA